MLRYSSVAYGFALGMVAVALVGIALTLAGASPNYAALAWLFALCVGLVPSAEVIIELVRLWRNDRLNEADRRLSQREREAALARTAGLSPVKLTRLATVNRATGTTYMEMPPAQRPARWLMWQLASEELLLWYLDVGALTVEALVGRGTRKAFSDRTAWGEMLAEWDRVGLARKENGVPTVLLRTPDEIRAMLTRGEVEWTLESDPPPIRPCPIPAEGVLENRPTALKVG